VRRVIVVKAGALGDGRVAAPALHALRRAAPAARIEWYGHAGAGRLFLGSGLVDHAAAFDDRRLTPLFAAPPRAGCSADWSDVDLAVVWLSERAGGPVVARNLARFGARRVVRFDPLPPADDRPVWGRLTDQLAEVGLVSAPTAGPAVILRPTAEAADWARRWLAERRLAAGELVVLHPGSGGPAKRWPSAGFAALARSLANEPGRAPVVAGGEEEAELVRAVAGGSATATLVGEPLDRFAAIAAVARAYVGNDAGPTHLAALLGVPTVAVFGPSDPRCWRPWGDRVQVCRPGAFDGAGVWHWLDDRAAAREVLRCLGRA